MKKMYQSEDGQGETDIWRRRLLAVSNNIFPLGAIKDQKPRISGCKDSRIRRGGAGYDHTNISNVGFKHIFEFTYRKSPDHELKI